MSNQVILFFSILTLGVIVSIVAYNVLIAFGNQPPDPVQLCLNVGKYYNPSTGVCERAGSFCGFASRVNFTFQPHQCPIGLTCKGFPFFEACSP